MWLGLGSGSIVVVEVVGLGQAQWLKGFPSVSIQGRWRHSRHQEEKTAVKSATQGPGPGMREECGAV